MDYLVYNKFVLFIWLIVDDCFCDVYVCGKYCDVILFMVVLCCLDMFLELLKEVVLEEVRF